MTRAHADVYVKGYMARGHVHGISQATTVHDKGEMERVDAEHDAGQTASYISMVHVNGTRGVHVIGTW